MPQFRSHSSTCRPQGVHAAEAFGINLHSGAHKTASIDAGCMCGSPRAVPGYGPPGVRWVAPSQAAKHAEWPICFFFVKSLCKDRMCSSMFVRIAPNSEQVQATSGPPNFLATQKFGATRVWDLAHPGNGTEVTSVRFYQQKVAKMKTVRIASWDSRFLDCKWATLAASCAFAIAQLKLLGSQRHRNKLGCDSAGSAYLDVLKWPAQRG